MFRDFIGEKKGRLYVPRTSLYKSGDFSLRTINNVYIFSLK